MRSASAPLRAMLALLAVACLSLAVRSYASARRDHERVKEIVRARTGSTLGAQLLVSVADTASVDSRILRAATTPGATAELVSLVHGSVPDDHTEGLEILPLLDSARVDSLARVAVRVRFRSVTEVILEVLRAWVTDSVQLRLDPVRLNAAHPEGNADAGTTVAVDVVVRAWFKVRGS